MILFRWASPSSHSHSCVYHAFDIKNKLYLSHLMSGHVCVCVCVRVCARACVCVCFFFHMMEIVNHDYFCKWDGLIGGCNGKFVFSVLWEVDI
jgi:hypothetical protein